MFVGALLVAGFLMVIGSQVSQAQSIPVSITYRTNARPLSGTGNSLYQQKLVLRLTSSYSSLINPITPPGTPADQKRPLQAATSGTPIKVNYPVKFVTAKSQCKTQSNSQTRDTAFDAQSNFLGRPSADVSFTVRRGANANSLTLTAEDLILSLDNWRNNDSNLNSAFRNATGYLCIEVQTTTGNIIRRGATATPVAVGTVRYRYLISERLDGVQPTVETIKVVSVNQNRTVSIGNKLRLEVTFNEPVRLLRRHGSTTAALPYIDVTNVGRFALVNPPRTNYSSKLVFERTIAYGDGCSGTTCADLDSNGSYLFEDTINTDNKINFGSYYLVDRAYNLPLHTRSATNANNYYFINRNAFVGATVANRNKSGFSYKINSQARLTAVRSGTSALVGTVRPSNYVATRRVSTVRSGSWFARVTTENGDANDNKRKDRNEACSKSVGSVYVTTNLDISGSYDHVARLRLPDKPNERYYCIGALDSFGRPLRSNWFKYVNDSTKPELSFTTANNVVSFKATDDSGIASTRWFVLISTARLSCSDSLNAARFSNSGDKITVRAPDSSGSNHNAWICVRVADTAGNITTKSVQLKYSATAVAPTTQPGTTAPTDSTTTSPTTSTTQAPPAPAAPTTSADDEEEEAEATEEESDEEEATEVEADASFSIVYNLEAHQVEIASGTELTDFVYAVHDGTASCASGSELTFNPVGDNNVIALTEADRNQSICVRGTKADGSFAYNQVAAMAVSTPETAETGVTTTTEETSSRSWIWILIPALGVFVIIVIVVVVRSQSNRE